jgi:hypothetical protein
LKNWNNSLNYEEVLTPNHSVKERKKKREGKGEEEEGEVTEEAEKEEDNGRKHDYVELFFFYLTNNFRRSHISTTFSFSTTF